MSKLSSTLRLGEGNCLTFWCPGCDSAHGIQVGEGSGPRWGWNNDAVKPTFTPSILVTHMLWTPPVTHENWAQWQASPWKQTQVKHVCHSFVTDGKIRFLGDCTHALKDQTVDIPPWPEYVED